GGPLAGRRFEGEGAEGRVALEVRRKDLTRGALDRRAAEEIHDVVTVDRVVEGLSDPLVVEGRLDDVEPHVIRNGARPGDDLIGVCRSEDRQIVRARRVDHHVELTCAHPVERIGEALLEAHRDRVPRTRRAERPPTTPRIPRSAPARRHPPPPPPRIPASAPARPHSLPPRRPCTAQWPGPVAGAGPRTACRPGPGTRTASRA